APGPQVAPTSNSCPNTTGLASSTRSVASLSYSAATTTAVPKSTSAVSTESATPVRSGRASSLAVLAMVYASRRRCQPYSATHWAVFAYWEASTTPRASASATTATICATPSATSSASSPTRPPNSSDGHW